MTGRDAYAVSGRIPSIAFGWQRPPFANWPIDADRLDSHLPDALSVQTYDGAGWPAVVPFVNVDTRPRGRSYGAGSP